MVTGWPWRIVVSWALPDTWAPCKLAWTWCTVARLEIGHRDPLLPDFSPQVLWHAGGLIADQPLCHLFRTDAW